MFTLRGYQVAAVNAALSRYGNSLLALPTGTGKTIVIADLAKRTRGRVLIAAHRGELLDQAQSKINQHTREPVGYVKGPIHKLQRCTVASVASLNPKRLERMQQPNLLVIDEAHHATASTYRRVIDWAGCRVIGVTATPYRMDEEEGDGWKLGKIFGRQPAYVYPLMDAVRDGYLVPIRQWGVQTGTSLDGCGMRGGDLAASGLLAVDTPERNVLVADSYRRLCEGRQAICFAASVAHAQNLATALGAFGVRSEAIWGDMPQTERERVLDDYRGGRIQVVANCGILTEGFDDPATSALLMARPTASRGLYVQMAGRGLRPKSGKEDCAIIDFLDSGQRHALSLQSALTLAGSPEDIPVQKHDAQGRDPVELAAELLHELEDYKRLIQTYPLEWSAKDLTPRWSAEKLSLAGYQPEARWQLRGATEKQLTTIKRFKFRPQRDLSRGEASALIDRLITLDNEDPEPATPKQISWLRWKGLVRGKVELTKREASRLIAGAR
jgi:superfamily II DNA or RNA helicase